MHMALFLFLAGFVLLNVSSAIVVPSGWSASSSGKYVISSSTYEDWGSAQSVCDQQGLKLASIHSLDDFNEVYSLIQATGHAIFGWLGVQKETSSEDWFDFSTIHNDDGSPYDYPSAATGQWPWASATSEPVPSADYLALFVKVGSSYEGLVALDACCTYLKYAVCNEAYTTTTTAAPTTTAPTTDTPTTSSPTSLAPTSTPTKHPLTVAPTTNKPTTVAPTTATTAPTSTATTTTEADDDEDDQGGEGEVQEDTNTEGEQTNDDADEGNAAQPASQNGRGLIESRFSIAVLVSALSGLVVLVLVAWIVCKYKKGRQAAHDKSCEMIDIDVCSVTDTNRDEVANYEDGAEIALPALPTSTENEERMNEESSSREEMYVDPVTSQGIGQTHGAENQNGVKVTAEGPESPHTEIQASNDAEGEDQDEPEPLREDSASSLYIDTQLHSTAMGGNCAQ